MNELVLDTLRTVSEYARGNEAEFTRQVNEMFSTQQAGTVKVQRKKLAASLAGLEQKVDSMRGKVNRIRADLKSVERRISTLSEHLKHSENFKNYRKVAEKYLRGVLQGRFDPKKLPPITKWREELAAKTAKRDVLYRENDALKNET